MLSLVVVMSIRRKDIPDSLRVGVRIERKSRALMGVGLERSCLSSEVQKCTGLMAVQPHLCLQGLNTSLCIHYP